MGGRVDRGRSWDGLEKRISVRLRKRSASGNTQETGKSAKKRAKLDPGWVRLKKRFAPGLVHGGADSA